MTYEEILNDPKPVFLGYNRKQLHEAFDAVKDKKAWKMPIDAIIPNDKIDVTAAAIGFFAGGEAEVFKLKNGKVRIIAPGYYNLIGA
jgi:hypothetical protein